jgi:predicted N-acetyltransferase YhbS
MARPEIHAFSDELLDAAAALLAARHTRHREAEPLLPAEVDFRAQLESEWRTDGASGVVATSGGRAIAYLVARPLEYGGGRSWMVAGIGGHAVDGDAELARDLYAAAAGRWADAGHTRHAVFVPSADRELVDAWFRLSFGASGALAMRETKALAGFDAGVEIRLGTPDDLEASARLDRAMHDSMRPSPSFSDTEAWTHEQYVDDWRDTWSDERYVHFVAERGGRVVGHIVLYRRPPDLRVPKDAIDLAAASSVPEVRGSGVGRALTEHVIAWAHANGLPTMTTDWRMTNLFASRFWPRRGFRTTFLRLFRSLA